ncbi:phosphate/phosphite/phosphonate ABC transporter substrate-binding protein [Holzapfeliella floricola]|uniref:ABC superfamily ATP binding cassette transporter, binding protein n=1 Tax=Holzapfeliella floricola DSM 23037 = JCM 16512 TaxID=1423744 RepID=A0A0R2DSD9_9LACO|nr:phosphate/phosphite/phosphonate ABC transporter substrate-binding protein [Holzapfeliella floricola]KRN04725.1 ABC superfamily ATP binding cassette transporter, binding protein [Holzapfeliella floricola DSM 23037 = JCM 16512]
MKKIKSLIAILAVSLLAVMLTACSKNNSGSSSESTSSTAKSYVPQSINLQVTPSVQAGEMENLAKPLGQMLSDKLGIPVNVTVATDSNSMVEAMSSKKVDMAFLSPGNYVKAHQRGAADVILQAQRYGQNDGKVTDQLVDSYRSMITVKNGSSIKSWEDLKGKKIAVQAVTSAAGYMLPVLELKDKGLDVETQAQLVTVKGHDQGIISVLNGDVDAAFTFEDARLNVQKDDPNIMNDVKAVYFTEQRIPNDTISVRSDMDEAFRTKLADAMIEIAKTPEGHKVVKSIASHEGYVKSDDSKFASMYKIEEALQNK